VLHDDALSLDARYLLVFRFTLHPLYLPNHSILGSEGYIFYFYDMFLLRKEQRIFGFTSYSLVTILIMLTQLPLLAIFLSFFLAHTMEK